MSIRSKWRAIRLFYKSRPLFRRVLKDYWQALLLPLFGKGSFETHDGIRFEMPEGKWTYLPTMCRLAEIGAQPSFEAGKKKILYDGLCFYSPEETKSDGVFMREVFVDDVYRLGSRTLEGRIVVDIGSFIGDTAIAMARKGATVYAFDPSRKCNAFLAENIGANGFTDKIIPMGVGLSNVERVDVCDGDELRFVEGIEYVLENLPKDIDLLKIDCEGCEYFLLGDPRFLAHLRPQSIALEYHRGGEEVRSALEAAGYDVEWPRATFPVGIMYGVRSSSQ